MTDSHKVYDIKLAEVKRAASVLHRTFYHDPFLRWSFVSEDNYINYGLPAFETWVKYSVLYGKAFRTQHFESIALRRTPQNITHPYNASYWKQLRCGVLHLKKRLPDNMVKRFKCLGEISRNQRNKNMGDQPFWHCWVLGTAPEYQNQGYANILMDHTFNLANNLPCYLTTANETSKKVHCHKGYRVLSEIILPESDIKLAFMARY